ncbi:MAG: RHS repeat-associated core domain-containing protein [Nibricoccus sp.]
MKKIITLIVTVFAAFDVAANVSWTTPPPASATSGQSYTLAASQTNTSCVAAYVYIYKNGAQVASYGRGGALGSYTVATSYTSTDNGVQTVNFRAEGWATTPMGGSRMDNSIVASTAITQPQSYQDSVGSADGSAFVGDTFQAVATGGSGSGAYVFQLVGGGSALGASVTSDGRITVSRAGTVIFRVMRLASGNYADSAWSATYVVTFTLDPNRDQDGDGIPNGWEQQYGLDPYNPADAAQGVASGSGFTNLEAYNLWIDPTWSYSDQQQRIRGSLSQLKLEFQPIGGGEITVTRNGGSTTIPNYTGDCIYVDVKDDTEEQATITATAPDYLIVARPDPLNPRITRKNILLNDQYVDTITKQEVEAAGNILKIRTSFASELPFGAVDTSRLEKDQMIQFGLGCDRAGRPVGTLTFNAGNYWDIDSCKAALVSLYPGPANQGVWSSGQLRTQLKGPAGYVDVQRSRYSYTIKFYAPGSYPQSGSLLDFSSATPLSVYQFDVSMPALTPLASNDQLLEGQPQTFNRGNALAVTMTRTTGGDTKILEFRTDWYQYKGPENSMSMDGGVTYYPFYAVYTYAVHRQWPARSVSAAKGGLTKLSYASRYHYWRNGPLTKAVTFTHKYQHAGSDDAGAILYREDLAYNEGDEKLYNSPMSQTIGAGADQHPGYGRGIDTEGNVIASIPSGGRIITDYFRVLREGGNNLGGQPWNAMGLERQTRSSFLDNAVNQSTDLISSYTYSPDLIDGKTVRISDTVTSGSTVIGQSVFSYQMDALNGRSIVVKTTNTYTASGSSLSTITKTYSARLADTDFRDRLASTTRPDGTKTSFAYQRGTLSGSTWIADESGPHLLIAQLDGKVGSSVGSYSGAIIDSLDLDPYKSSVTERIVDSADRVLRESSYVYTGGSSFPELSSVYYRYDDLGNLTCKADRADWTGRIFYEAGFTGFRKDWEKDESGITRSYTYDDYDRVYTMTRASASEGANIVQATTTTYLYDPAGRLKTETVSGVGTGETLVTSYDYDTAGRITRRVLPGNLTTSVAYPSATSLVTTLPGDGVKTETVYADGRPKSVSGPAVPDTSYTYSYDSSTGNLTTTQATAGQTITTVADWLNRTLSVSTPTWGNGTRVVTNEYNATTGQLQRQTTTSDGLTVAPAHIFNYDAFGRLFREGFTTNSAYTLGLNLSADYGIKEYETGYQTGAPNGHGSNWYQYARVKVYPYDGSTSTVARYASQSYTQVSGLGASMVAHIVAIDFDHNLTDSFTYANRANKRLETVATSTGTNQAMRQISINGLPVSATNAQGQTTLQAYDALGRLQASSDPRIGTTSYTYRNGSALAETITTPDLHATTLGYDSAGRVTSRSDQTGKAAYFRFDEAGNQTHQWGDTVNPVRFEYNELGQKTKMHTYRSGTWTGSTLPSGFGGDGDVTTWNYQAATGLLQSKVDAANRSTSYTYNAMGQIATRTDARNVLTSYNYTPLNLLWTVTYNDGLTANLTYTYDRAGRTKTVTDVAGQRSLDYYDTSTDPGDEGDLLNKSARLKNENLPAFLGSHTLNYNYQYGVSGRLNGATSGLKLDSGILYNVGYGYDAVLRLNTISYNNLIPFTYTYTNNSNLVATIEQLTGGSSWNYSRDYTYRSDSNRIDTIAQAWGIANPVSTRVGYFGLDGVGQANSYGLRATEKTTGGAYANLLGLSGGWGSYTNYSYTDRQELGASGKYQLNTDGSAGGAQAGAARSYGFDAMGNRTADQNGSYTPNALNQYEATPFAGAISYDANGNLTNDGMRGFAYDAENRLIAVTQGSSVWNYKYDYLGRRVEKSGTGIATTRYIYDGWNLIAELDSNGTLTRRFAWGPDVSGTAQGAGGVGGLLLIDAYLGGNSQYYPFYDASHNVLGLYDGSGSVAAAYQYDPFGNLQSAAGSYSTANPFRSATKYTDDETGLIYYGMRYYQPNLGRFINRDPAEEQGGINLYAFCGNDGVNRYDLLGMVGADVGMQAQYQKINEGKSSDPTPPLPPPPPKPEDEEIYEVQGKDGTIHPIRRPKEVVTASKNDSDVKAYEASQAAAANWSNEQALKNNAPNSEPRPEPFRQIRDCSIAGCMPLSIREVLRWVTGIDPGNLEAEIAKEDGDEGRDWNLEYKGMDASETLLAPVMRRHGAQLNVITGSTIEEFVDKIGESPVSTVIKYEYNREANWPSNYHAITVRLDKDSGKYVMTNTGYLGDVVALGKSELLGHFKLDWRGRNDQEFSRSAYINQTMTIYQGTPFKGYIGYGATKL